MRRVRIEKEGDKTRIYTLNLVKGNRVYNEELRTFDNSEYRSWDPFRSKLAAAILKGLDPEVIKEGDRVLYLGVSTGTTASHISDIIGENGILIGVEFAPRVAREFIERVAKKRKNVIPFLADARFPNSYSGLGKVDVVYCDIAQPDQTEIAINNCKVHLKKGGKLLLVIKTRSIDVLSEPKSIVEQEKKKLIQSGFSIISDFMLEPFDKDHSLIYAIF